MKKIFKTVALATALAVGAATFSGCTGPLDPTSEDTTTEQTEDNDADDNNADDETADNPTTEEPTTEDPTTEDPTTEEPTNTGMITLALSKNTADPNDIETKRAITTGLDMTKHGDLYTFPREVVFEASQFESGKTYYVEGTAGNDTIRIVDGYGDTATRRFNIVSKNVQVVDATRSVISVNIEMPVLANGDPADPYISLPAVECADGTITGTKMLLIQKPNGSYYRL